MIALDLMGAGAGLATQTIMVRIRNIDTALLKKSIAGSTPCAKCGFVGPAPEWANALATAIALADTFPSAALTAAMPIAKQQLREIGITADLSTTKTAPGAWSPGDVTVGAVLGILMAIAARWGYRRLKG